MLVSILLLFFAIWRIDNPRIERLRADVIDTIIPHFEWVLRPATWAGRILENFQSYQALYQQNQELNRELQKMKSWKEAALQLEQENARLLDLNNLRQDPTLTHVSGIVIADSGDTDQLSAMARRTCTLISTVGPYAQYGTPVLEACANEGTHYCDLTGEAQWMAQVYERINPIAKASGARSSMSAST